MTLYDATQVFASIQGVADTEWMWLMAQMIGVGTEKAGEPKARSSFLKLHGSLNWRGPFVPLRLRAEPYKPVANGVIAPPLTNKPVTDPPLSEIWRKARTIVGSMRRLVIVGYSMPAADGLVRTLLATDLSANLEDVVLVDPSETTLVRHVDFFGRVSPKAKIITLRSLKQFGSVL